MNIDHTILIGAGGAGGLLIQPLARLLNFHPNSSSIIRLCDGDRFEAKNAERQLCSESDVGRSKVEVHRRIVQQQGLDTIATYDDFVDERAFRDMLRIGSTLVIASVDNDATRKMTLDVVAELLDRQESFFWLTAGNADNEHGDAPIRGVCAWWGYDAATDTTYGQDPRKLYHNIGNPSDDIPRRGSCAAHAPSHPQLITANAITATLMLTVVQNLLDGTLESSSMAAHFDWRCPFKFTFS